MADAEAVMAAVPRRDDVSYIGLVLNRRGLERAIAAGVDELHVAVWASDTFGRRNQGQDVADGLRVWDEIAPFAHAAGVSISVSIAAAFGCPFEGEVAPARVAEIARELAQSAPFEIAIADTIGVGVPAQVTEVFGRVAEAAPGVALRAHFHNTRNTGIANAWAAMMAGASVLDASLGGIGGCPFAPAATGNIATEDLVYMLGRAGVETGVDLGRAIEAARWIEPHVGHAVPGMLTKAGDFPGARRAAG
jgi:hydroxymethylglutaryl-CoA lyase